MVLRECLSKDLRGVPCPTRQRIGPCNRYAKRREARWNQQGQQHHAPPWQLAVDYLGRHRSCWCCHSARHQHSPSRCLWLRAAGTGTRIRNGILEEDGPNCGANQCWLFVSLKGGAVPSVTQRLAPLHILACGPMCLLDYVKRYLRSPQ